MPQALPHELLKVLEDHQVELDFPEDVMAEVAALEANPGIDDARLPDLTALPFVTIDYATSRDLDQALQLERAPGGGYLVRYALADAAHFVRPGTALFREALARGVSLYLPGLTVPMLPNQLSEGIVSLNPKVDRRALVFEITLDARGNALGTRVVRARIHSQAKLSYDGVQAAMDAGWAEYEGAPYAESLRLMAHVGELRMAEARTRDVISFDRQEVEVDVEAGELTISSRSRCMISRYNEQISLLCNIEGGRLLLGDGTPEPHVQPVYRVHEAPDEDSLDRLEQVLLALARAHGLETSVLAWRRARGEPPGAEAERLGAYLERLRGEDLPPPLMRTVQRQCLIANSPSRFTDGPGIHFALGVQPYSRFSAPMREIVGVFTHKEALEQLGLAPVSLTPGEDEQLRELVIQAGNNGKERQRALDRAVRHLAIDTLLGGDLERPLEQRPVRSGTVLGLRPSRAYVRLDDPPLEVKVYREDLEAWAGAALELSDDEVLFRETGTGAPRLLMGQGIRVRTAGKDPRRHRWVLEPV